MNIQIGNTGFDQCVGSRDAIHVPVVVVTSNSLWDAPKSGNFVRFTDTGLTTVQACDELSAHAIVDPFIPSNTILKPGVKFLVFVLPKFVGRLNHHVEINIDADDIKSSEVDYDECAGCYDVPVDNDYNSCKGCY